MNKIIDFITPLEGECNLGNEIMGDQCCCICDYHLTDYWHCMRMPKELKPENKCGCQVIRGYICTAGEIFEGVGGSSGWPKHSMGCECFVKRTEESSRKGRTDGILRTLEIDQVLTQNNEAI